MIEPVLLSAIRGWVAVALIPIVGSLESLSAQSSTLTPRTGTQWSPYVEWSLENPSHQGNPFDLEARAVFVHRERGDSITTSMFYDGGHTWKFRFTGTRPGEWSFRTVGTDRDLGGKTGSVTIRGNPGARGFMRGFGSKWGWQGSGEVFVPQYVMAKELSAYRKADGSIDSTGIDAAIREFVEEHGFTGFHFAADGKWFDGQNPDPGVYRALEQMIHRVHQKGGASHIWLWGSHDASPRALTGGPMTEMDRRNLRYLAARLGPVPGWSMGYGFDTENGWASREELDTWKSYLQEQMGWDHMLGARVGWDEKGLFGVSPRPPRPPHDAGYRAPIEDRYTTWLGGDYIGYTSYRPLFPRYLEAVHHHPEKPSFEEDRFRLRNRPEWIYKDYDAELTRRGLWHSAMAGGVANIWGNLLPEPDRGGSRAYPNKEQIRTYARFFERRFLKEMLPAYDGPELRLATPDTVAGGGTHLIVYREDTDIVRMDLRRMSGDLPAVAVDAKAPYREIDLGLLPRELHTWQAPYRSDWAVAVGHFVAPAGTRRE